MTPGEPLHTYKIAVFREFNWVQGTKLIAYNSFTRRQNGPDFVGIFTVQASNPIEAKKNAIKKAKERFRDPDTVPRVGCYGCGCDGKDKTE